MKDHEKRELINKLTDIAVRFGQTQQIRSRLQDVILPVLAKIPAQHETVKSNVSVPKFHYAGIDYSKK